MDELTGLGQPRAGESSVSHKGQREESLRNPHCGLSLFGQTVLWKVKFGDVGFKVGLFLLMLL